MPPRIKTGPLTIVGERAIAQQDALFATPEEGAAFVESLTAEQRVCRERRRHLFDIPLSVEIHPPSAKGPDGTVDMKKLRAMIRTAMCRCGSIETKVADRNGVVVEKPTVKYSDGYVARKIGRIPKESIGIIRRDHWIHDALALEERAKQENAPKTTRRRKAAG